MHTALRKGPLFTKKNPFSTFLQNTPFSTFYKNTPIYHFFTKKTPPHFISCLRAWLESISSPTEGKRVACYIWLVKLTHCRNVYMTLLTALLFVAVFSRCCTQNTNVCSASKALARMWLHIELMCLYKRSTCNLNMLVYCTGADVHRTLLFRTGGVYNVWWMQRPDPWRSLPVSGLRRRRPVWSLLQWRRDAPRHQTYDGPPHRLYDVRNTGYWSL